MGGLNFSILMDLHGKLSPAAAGRCPWPAQPPSAGLADSLLETVISQEGKVR